MTQTFLFYGLLIPENLTLPSENVPEMGWEEIIAARSGLFSPDCLFKGNEGKYKEYWDKTNKIVRDMGVSLEILGKNRFVCVKESIFVSVDNTVELVNIEEINYCKWDSSIKKFCELLDLKIDTEPSWILTSIQL